MKRALVTGGAGFLGSHLCDRLLEDGFEVVCVDNFDTGRRGNIAHLIDNPRFSLIRHDVTRPLDVQVDAIYHLACPASPPHYQRNPVRTIKTCVDGTLQMLELAREHKARLLFTSTSEVYGDPEEHPQRESYWGHVNPIGERACYDEGKRCAEALISSFVRFHGLEARVARIFNTYGPRMREDDGRVISNFVVQALRGEPLTIYGEGQQTRSFCYVTDLIEGLVRLMATPTDPGPVNLGNPTELTVRQVADLVLQMTGSRSAIVQRPLPPDDPTRRKPSIERAERVLGWGPSVTVEDGLAATIEHFRSVAQPRRAAAKIASIRRA